MFDYFRGVARDTAGGELAHEQDEDQVVGCSAFAGLPSCILSSVSSLAALHHTLFRPAMTASSITVESGMTGQSITAIVNSGTQFDSVPTDYSKCASAKTCISVGSIVSLDALLSPSGTLTANEIDALDATATDEVEGILYSASSTGVVAMILADKFSTTGNDPLAAFGTTFGSQIFLTANPSAVYVVDAKTLSSLPPFIGFSGSGDQSAGSS